MCNLASSSLSYETNQRLTEKEPYFQSHPTNLLWVKRLRISGALASVACGLRRFVGCIIVIYRTRIAWFVLPVYSGSQNGSRSAFIPVFKWMKTGRAAGSVNTWIWAPPYKEELAAFLSAFLRMFTNRFGVKSVVLWPAANPARKQSQTWAASSCRW